MSGNESKRLEIAFAEHSSIVTTKLQEFSRDIQEIKDTLKDMGKNNVTRVEYEITNRQVYKQFRNIYIVFGLVATPLVTWLINQFTNLLE